MVGRRERIRKLAKPRGQGPRADVKYISSLLAAALGLFTAAWCDLATPFRRECFDGCCYVCCSCRLGGRRCWMGWVLVCLRVAGRWSLKTPRGAVRFSLRHVQTASWAHGVVVSHPLSMREALGSIPSVSISVSQTCTTSRTCSGSMRGYLL